MLKRDTLKLVCVSQKLFCHVSLLYVKIIAYLFAKSMHNVKRETAKQHIANEMYFLPPRRVENNINKSCESEIVLNCLNVSNLNRLSTGGKS